MLITAALLGGVVAVSPGEDMRTIRRLIGFGDERLGQAPDVPTGSGQYAFTLTQPGGRRPVGYSPCQVIEVEVNPEGAPENYADLVDTAIAHTSEATGLRFELVGTTDTRDFDLGGFGLTRKPVLVAWADADEVPDLEGDVAGLGGSIAVDSGTGRLRYVTGSVVLDEDTFDGLDPDSPGTAQAIVDHEFGHLVGLAHVDDPRELMYADNVGQTGYGPGDREGLALLGGIPC